MTPLADPALPGLAVATNIESVAARLRDGLSSSDRLDVIDGTIVDVRYEPGRRCTVLYRLKIRHPGRRGGERRLFVGRALGEDDAPSAVELARGCFFADARLLIAPFGVDRAMPALESALDPRAVRRALQRLWSPSGIRIRKVQARLLGYTPDARAAFVYEVLAEDARTRVPVLRRLIGKMHAKKSAARLFAGSWAIWRDAALQFGLAPPVGYLPALGLTLQERLEGERLGGLAGSRSFSSLVRQTARAIAHFHALRVPLTTWRRPADESQVVRRWAGVLAAVRSDEGVRIQRLADRLTAAIESRTSVTAPVHGDFHHTNVLVGPDRHISLIDLDESAYGDPLVDVGRFLASLRIPSLREFGDLRRLQPVQDAFLTEYLSHGPADEPRVRLFESASLLTAAASAFRLQRQTWRDEVRALVEESERLARLAGAFTTHQPVASRKPARPQIDRLSWLLDGTYVRAALDPHLQSAYGNVEIAECRASLRSETPKAYRLRYELTGWKDRARWTLALTGLAPRDDDGSGRTTSRRLTELRDALAASPEALLLPRPVTYLSALALLVLEVPDGVPFSTLIGSPAGPEAAISIARALAALHRTGLPSGASRRSVDEELAAVRRDLERVAGERADFHSRAARLVQDLGRHVRRTPERVATTLQSPHPRHLLWHRNRVALAEPASIVAAHPLTDTAHLLARVRLIALHRDRALDCTPTADRLRQSSVELERIDPDELRPLEASALIRLACSKACRNGDGLLAESLLEHAEERLAS